MSYALVIAALVILLGAIVQGAAGYGMNLVAAPILALVDPALLPAPLLLLAAVHAILAATRERHHVDWSGVGWTMVGRLPGTVIGVIIVATLPQGPFAIVVGVVVLACVLLSLTSWHPRPTPGALTLGGGVGGIFGTAATIGGPPIALLYQHQRGPTIRSTLAMYFLLGSLLSVAALAVGGQVDTTALLQAAALLPFMLLGFALSNPVKRFLDTGWMRTAVLTVASVSAAVLIVENAVG
ncbi:TSUP family transporter [Haloechinothrix sp. LS1_15]|uniref:TSUP family transporter n=1 Tax=Haloechinothrix sp. LS1_15 TaxID=2652248 RepID=UPI002946493B|nr:TSUP family transporter [Haloechinothrix sp. LS1_15]MDV6012192.1 TSUP family transporter [Haloechinothrix sp. LS1_15]